MSDLLGDGNVKVSWVPTIANIHSPTTTELNAGTPLEQFITPDGLKIDPDTATVDTSSLASTFDTAGAGRRKFGIELMLKRQTAPDTIYNLLVYRTSGYLVVRRTMACTVAWTSAQVVEVYPVQTGERKEKSIAPNEIQKWTSPMFVTSDPDKSAVIA